MSDKLDKLVETKAAVGRKRIIFIGFIFVLLGSVFFLGGLLLLFLTIKNADITLLPAGLFLIFLGTPALFGYRLILYKHRQRDDGLFPPRVIFVFGVFIIIGSIAMQLDRPDWAHLIFSILFGAACIYLALKRWRSA